MDPHLLGYEPFFSAQFDLLQRPDLVPARVLSDGKNAYHLGGATAPLGELSGKLHHTLSALERPIAGDWVAVADDSSRAVIHHVLDRRTALIRRAAGFSGRGQVVAANVDVFFIVTSANLDLNPRRLERYISAVWDSGASPVLVINKVELCHDVDALIRGVRATAQALPVVPVSASTGEGIDQLRSHIPLGATIGFVGSSGVGKSSLVNCLLGHDGQRVREIRSDDKGRHATTRRELFEVPGVGMLLDTPGMRELGLVTDDGGVDASFEDISSLATRCHFGDCQHAGEPGCAVDAAVEAGDIDERRLAGYRKLQREIAAAERLRDPVLQSRSKRRWKSIHKAQRARSKVDPKRRQ